MEKAVEAGAAGEVAAEVRADELEAVVAGDRRGAAALEAVDAVEIKVAAVDVHQVVAAEEEAAAEAGAATASAE